MESEQADNGLDGRVLADRYQVVRASRPGASSVIADAIDLQADRPVTVKIVLPEFAADAEFRRKFRHLAELSNALTHPNIASVLDWGEVEYEGESTVFWTVEALGGGSLRDLLDRGRLLEPGQALVVGLEACRALDAAHQKGLFHTELTPSKMVFGADRRLRVIDFGMARLLGETAWSDVANVPTHVARYASPEQALGINIDAKTDVYALSLVLVESVTGAVPFAGDSTQATLAGRIDKLLPVSADLGSLAAVLERAGRPESADRFTAAEFGRALVQAAGKLPKPEPIPIIATGLFDTTTMRRPSDPTGGVERPPEPELEPETPDDPAEPEAETPETPESEAETPEPETPEPETPEPETEPESADDDLRLVDDTGPNGTEQMPAAVADSALAATSPTTALGITEPDDVVEPAAPVAAPSPIFDDPDFVEPRDGTGEIYDDRPKRRKGPIVLLVLLLLAGLGGLAYAGSLLLETKSFEVPVLAGTSEGLARNQIEGNDWEITVERERSDTFPEPGTVIRTEPGPGVDLEEGESITLVLSDGFEFRSLPDVSNLTAEAARAQLEDLLLVVTEAPEREFSEEVPDGTVISWQVVGNATLQAGANVLPGDAVQLTVSKGPEPRETPDVGGLTLDEATAALADLQLEIAVGDEVFSDDVEIGRIVSQTPTVGEQIERGGVVTVQASKGPDFIALPDLDGLSYREAEELLLSTGFEIGTLLGTTDGTFVQLTIDGEEVAVGTEYRRGQIVDVIFL